MAHEPALNLPNPWAAVGRDTEAGRALFALYNGFGHARSRGNDYSQMNRMKHLRHIAMHGVPEFPVPKPLPPEKPKVKVPHFPQKSNYAAYDYHPVDFIPRRRRAAEILQQIRDDSYEVEMPPMPKGPLLDDAEKARLQEVFYWSNRNLVPEPPVAEPVRRLPKKGSIEEQELLLNEIAKEIEDREAFLTEMEEYGKGEQYRGQILFEIQQRVGQMKLLHENITEQEKRESAKRSGPATPRVTYAPMPPAPKSHARGQPRKANQTFNLSITGASLPHFDPDPRFQRPPGRTYATNRDDDTPKHETSTAAHADPWTTTTTTTTRTDSPGAATANVIKTASCYGTTESQPPTPPPSARPPAPAPTKKASNLHPDFPSTASPTGSAGARSSSSTRGEPRNRANANSRHGASWERSGVAPNPNAVGSTPWDAQCWNGSDGRSPPSSVSSDPRSRTQYGVRFQESILNSNAEYPRGSSSWDGGCSPAGSPHSCNYDRDD